MTDDFDPIAIDPRYALLWDETAHLVDIHLTELEAQDR